MNYLSRKIVGSDLTMDFDDYAKTWDTDKRIKRAKAIANEISKSIGSNE